MIIGEFVDTYPPQVDGVGQVTLSYCRALTDMGHECYYIAPDAPGGGYYAFPVLLQKSLKIPGEMYRLTLPALDIGYRKQIDRIPFDIVHTHSPFSAGEEARRIARRRDIPLVTTFHSKYYQDFYDKTHSRLIAEGVIQYIIRFYNQCDSVWTVNQATAEVLREYGYRGPVEIMENGTDIVPLDPAGEKRLEAKLTLPQGRPVLLFVGQHNYKKNLHGVLGACAILKRSGVPFSLVTAGTGPDFDAIREEARSLGIAEDCTFLGFMSDRAELMALFHRADLLVFPSVYDNAPMVLREAASMGTPGVLVRGSCAAEGVRDGVNGFICEDESAEAISRAILRGLPLAGEVGAEAQRTIPVRWEHIMQQVVARYKSLITAKGANM